MNLISKIFSPYVRGVNEYGLPKVSARTWHPAWFIPFLRHELEYKLGYFRRYKAYQKALSELSQLLSGGYSMEVAEDIEAIIMNLDCGFECGLAIPYGWVPEAGCLIHDH